MKPRKIGVATDGFSCKAESTHGAEWCTPDRGEELGCKCNGCCVCATKANGKQCRNQRTPPPQVGNAQHQISEPSSKRKRHRRNSHSNDNNKDGITPLKNEGQRIKHSDCRFRRETYSHMITRESNTRPKSELAWMDRVLLGAQWISDIA